MITTALKIAAVAAVIGVAGFVVYRKRKAVRSRTARRTNVQYQDGPRRTVMSTPMDGTAEAATGERPIDLPPPDIQAILTTRDLAYTKKYLQLVGTPDGPKPDMRWDTGALKGVQDAAESWKQFDDWLEALVAASGGEIALFVPQVGGDYENAEMLCFTEDKIVTMALARVTKVLSHGLRRADGSLILRALVEASDTVGAKDGTIS